MIEALLIFVGGTIFGVAGGILLLDYILLRSWMR